MNNDYENTLSEDLSLIHEESEQPTLRRERLHVDEEESEIYHSGWSTLKLWKFSGRELRAFRDTLQEDGWLEFLERYEEKIPREQTYKKLFSGTCSRRRGETEEVTYTDAFMLNIYYCYDEENGNRLVLPDVIAHSGRYDQMIMGNFLLETMRVNRLTPKKITRKRLGFPYKHCINFVRETRACDLFSTELGFYHPYDSTLLSKDNYPTLDSLEEMIQGFKYQTPGEGQSFEEVLKAISAYSTIEVESEDILKYQRVHINFDRQNHGTLCDFLDTLGNLPQVDAVWDWVGKKKVFFTRKEVYGLSMSSCCDDLI